MVSGTVKKNLIGYDPPDERTCALLCDETQTLLEAYVYEVGLFRFNWHPSLEILFCLKGRMKICTEHGIFDLEEDDFTVILPNEAHATRFLEKDTRASAIHISLPYIEKLGLDPASLPVSFTAAGNAHSDARPLFHNALALIYLSLIHKCDACELLTQAQVSLLLFALTRQTQARNNSQKQKMTQARRRIVHTMIEYLDRHFREKISLPEIAELAGQNPSSASTLFSAYAGVGFHEYLTRKRLHHAAYLLNTTDATLVDIAAESGFPDVKSFHTAFKKYLFQTPGEYRKTLQNSEPDDGSSVKNMSARKFLPSDEFVQKKMSHYLNETVPLETLLCSKE